MFWQAAIGIFTATAAVTAAFVSAQTLNANTTQQEQQQRQQASERFGKAIEQLASDEPELRLGGIYSLEQLAGDSPPDHPAVFEVLAAYARSHAPLGTGWCALLSAGEQPRTLDQPTAVPLDVQAVVTVIGRRDTANDSTTRLDLSETCLTDVPLEDAHLAGADLAGADLYGANLSGADLTART